MIFKLTGWSASKYSAIIGGFACTAYMYQNQSWVSQWEPLAQMVSTSLLLLLPGTVLTAAIDAQRLIGRRHSSIVPRNQIPLRRWIQVFTALLLPGSLVIAALFGLATITSLGNGYLVPGSVLVVLLPFAWLAVYVAFGIMVAAFLPLIWIAPISIAVGFVMPLITAAEPDTFKGLLSPVDDGIIFAPYFLRPQILAIQIGGCAAVSVLLVGVVSRRGKSIGRRLIVAACAVVIASLAVTVTAIGPARRYSATMADGPRSCDESICVWADHQDLLEPAEAAFRAFAKSGLQQAWARYPSGVVEQGLLEPEGWVHFSTGTAFSSSSEIAVELADQMISLLYCGDGVLAAPPPSYFERRAWLLQGTGLPGLTNADKSIAGILDQRIESQIDWWLDVGAEPAQCRIE